MKPLIVTAVTCSLLLGCAPGEGEGRAGVPDVLRLAVLPNQDEAEMRSQFAPLQVHMAEALGIEVALEVPASYEALLEGFGKGDYHLALLGGVTFILAQDRFGAIPLVMRDIDFEFTSSFIAHSTSTGEDIHDFADKAISFGPRLSTSGHVMPLRYLSLMGIDPQSFFSEVRHSGAHDETARAVRDGTSDVGVLSSVVLEAMFADGRLAPEGIRLLMQTAPYRDYVWAVQPSLDEGLRDRIRDAFLGLQPTRPEQAGYLRSVGAGAYFPASVSDFDQVRAAVHSAGILDEGDPR